MTFPTGDQIDIIATKILFDAKEAILQLKGWQNSINEGAQRTLFFKEVIKSVAKQMDGDMKSATAAVKEFAKSLGINPTLLTKIGKELEVISAISKKMGIGFAEAESRFGGFALTVASGTKNMVLFGAAFQSAIASGLPLLTATQTGLIAISSQIAIIKAQLSQGGSKTPLLGSGGAGAGGVPPDFIDAEWEEVSNSANKAAGAMNNAENSAKKAGVAGADAGKKTESGFKKAVTAVNVLRIAMGVLVSMGIFAVGQAIAAVFGGVINQLQEFEATLYRISNVERELSLKGVEISVAGLKKGVQDIRNLLPIFSEEDVAQMIGSLATATSHLGLAEDQILKLGKAIAILNVQSVEEETLLQTQSKIVNAIVTSQSKGVGNLGITFSKNRMEAEALELGLLKLGESVSKLSDAEKTQVKLAIVFDKAGIETSIEELQALQTYLESSDAKSQELKATWADFLRDVGIQFAPLIIEFLQTAIDTVKGWTESLERNKETWDVIVAIMAGVARVQHDINAESQNESGLEKFLSKISPALTQLSRLSSKSSLFSFSEGFNESIKKANEFGNAIETATGQAVDGAEDSEEALSEIADALAEIDEKARDIALDAEHAQEDLDIRRDQKQADLDTEYSRKKEDEARDYGQKIVDINQDARDKIEDANRKSREDEKRAEEDLLQKLKELRQRFLMDLEDALHARDARQILRLIKEYNFDKQNILDRKKLDDKQRKDKLADELRDIEIERKRKLEQAKIEHDRKLADLAEAKRREQDELALWYAREQEDIANNVRQKLEKLLDGYAQEGILHEEQLGLIDEILRKHFGGQMGMIDQLVAYAQTRFAEMAALSVVSPYSMGMGGGYIPAGSGGASPFSSGGGIGGRTSTRTGGRTPSRPSRVNRIPSFADGGTLIARQPTLALFGERSPEIAQFTPINQLNRGGGGGSFEGGMDGQIGLEILLSPDLEARIVRNTMERTGKIVTKITRQK